MTPEAVSSEAPGRRLTVGAVVRTLAEEFPDVTISKVRFLEAEGLVTPTRTPSGYRQFTPADVERLRYVLRAQRDLFWPLRVIKDNLEAIDRGLTPGGGADVTVRDDPPCPVCREADNVGPNSPARTRSAAAPADGMRLAARSS